MALQDIHRLAVDALSILADPRPSSAQPPIPDGIHVRWTFGRDSAFPLHGYYLFRRAESGPNERCLTKALAGRKPGPIGGNQLVDPEFGTITAFLLTLGDEFAPLGLPEVVIPPPGNAERFETGVTVELPEGVRANRVTAKIGLGREGGLGSVLFTPMRDGVPIERLEVLGNPGDVVEIERSFWGISSIVIDGGPASIIELCYFTQPDLAGEAIWTSGSTHWTYVPSFPYPLTLPIAHPGYPALPGIETLSTHRATAAARVAYGTAADALPAKAHTPGTGTITLTAGSAIARGNGTAWGDTLVGKLIYPASLDTAFAVMTVIRPDRLVLSRPFTGTQPLVNATYKVCDEDVFAQLHDNLGALLSEPNGMRAATMPPVLEQSTASRHMILTEGSKVGQGVGAAWDVELVGLLLEVGPNRDVYRIEAVDKSLQQITLNTPFAGKSGPADYRIVSRSPHNRVEEGSSLSIPPLDLLELASISPAYAQILGLYWIDRMVDPRRSYEYIVLADHEGRFHGNAAEALEWVNGLPDFSGTAVDGATIGPIAHNGSGALAAPSTLQVFALPGGRPQATPDRPDLADSEVGVSIGDLAQWPSLPPAQRPVLIEMWRYGHGPKEPLAKPPLPELHVRAGDAFAPSLRKPDPNMPRPPGWPDPSIIHFLDAGQDGLEVGWYSYRASAVDLWGRHSALSGPIPWRKVSDGSVAHSHAVHLEDHTPPPPPTDFMAWLLEPDGVPDPSRVADEPYRQWRTKVGPKAVGLRLNWKWPWPHVLRAPDLAEFRIYAQSTPINARLHQIVSVKATAGDATRSDVHLAAGDSLPPDAYAGARLQIDARSFAIERSSGGTALTLRVKNGGPTQGEPPPLGVEATIVLPPGHPLHRDLFDQKNWDQYLTAVAHQAPSDATIGYDVDPVEDPGVVLFDSPQNPLRGISAQWKNQRARLLDATTSLLGAVRPGIDVIALGSDDASLYAVLQIQAANEAIGEIEIAGVPPVWLTPGSYRWAIGPARKDARGTGATWNSATRTLTLAKTPDLSQVRQHFDRVYVKVVPASTPQQLQHFFEIERVDVAGRRLVLRDPQSLLTNNASYEWRIGSPLRTYELFLPSKANGSDDPNVDQWLRASLADPVVYATVGISAADKRTENLDVRPGRSRPGNEGRLAAPATIFRVQREIPDPPADDVWSASRLSATRADYHGKSYFTVRWKKPTPDKRPHYKAVVLRTMDETLFLVDWEQTRTVPLSLTGFVPAHWSSARAASVTTDFAAYQTLRGKTTFEDALPLYRALSDDALSVLANLPGNDEAFAERTLDAVAIDDPSNADRRGPDDDLATFPGVNPDLNAWTDQLDGRSRNRYFYKIAYVDTAHNRGPLGKASPAVYLPKTVAPRAPVITKVVGGDRQITLKWAANREPDLAGYRIYRTADGKNTPDVRLMELIQTLSAGPIPSDGQVTFIDSAVASGVTLHYCIAAVDAQNNVSAPSKAVSGRAFRTAPPDAPLWDHVDSGTTTDGSSMISLHWTAAEPLLTLVQRCEAGTEVWRPLTGWLKSATFDENRNLWPYQIDDLDPVPLNRYRIVAQSADGTFVVTSAEYEL